MGLVVAFKEWLGLGDVGPLGKALAPPFVIFGDGVILWKVEGNQSRLRHFLPGRRSDTASTALRVATR